MKIKVDNRLIAVEFGRAIPRPDQVRYYYQLAVYDDWSERGAVFSLELGSV